ncbi:SDR family NAD(P)-dependent oxidoreductase [Nocardia terpenica]|uniref:Short-chain dehydrogenase n=1 Tax=Nocardia terpenica TaxID=455432 RepID=A0A291RN75_9NOCA|nr:SDR family NAD(P)-dependent oxidoreductase [Nocardia terpenica]ATL68827.1 short-chain dehydrogenase [Nocardia terpenica]
MPITTDDTASGKVALVTGASRALGLGFAVARELATRGYHAILAGRDLARTEHLADQLVSEGLPASAIRLDVTDRVSIADGVEFIRTRFGRLDALINNAARMPDFTTTALLDADMNEVRAAYDVDVIGTWALTQACLPLLKAAPAARIVNLSSAAVAQIAAGTALSHGVYSPGYSMAKYALDALTASLAAELRDTGILVNAVDPGEVATHPERGDEATARPAAESAPGIVWAATLPIGGPTGGLFRDGQPFQWVSATTHSES